MKIFDIIKEARIVPHNDELHMFKDEYFTDEIYEHIHDWEELFEIAADTGDLHLFTQSDILGMLYSIEATDETIDYVMGLPLITQLEQG